MTSGTRYARVCECGWRVAPTDPKRRNEATPVGGARQTPIQPRRRHFQHVSLFHRRTAGVEPRLDRSRRFRAVINRDLLRVPPINAHVEQRPTFASTAPELNQVIAEPVKLFHNNEFQRVVHLVSH